MIGISVEDHGWVGVEPVLPSNLPHVGAIEVWLSDAKDNEDGNQPHQFKRHQPPGRLA